MKRFVTLRISVGALLMILLALVLVVVGVVMYRNYAFHNRFFDTLSTGNIESVTIFADNDRQTDALDRKEIEELVMLMKNIRLSEKPYKNVQVMGSYGGYEIVFKTGIRFCVGILSLEEVGLVVIGENFHPVADLGDVDSLETKNFLMLESLYSQHVANYFG